MRVCVFAFGSWAKARNNPPKLILEKLTEPSNLADLSDKGIELVGIDTPVEGDALQDLLTEVLTSEKADYSFGVGLGSGRPTIDLETTAINTKHYSVADNNGSAPYDERIINSVEAPAAYRSSVDNAGIVEALSAAGIPARLSHHAGTHCCNQLLYLSHHICVEHNLDTKCGFIHVPYLHSSITSGEVRNEPSMALGTLVEAFKITLYHLASRH